METSASFVSSRQGCESCEVKVLVPPIACRPEHKRVWASLAQSPEKVITAMFDEAAHRDPTSQIRWVALRKALAARMPLIPIE